MKRVFCYIIGVSFLLNSGAFAAPHSIPMGHMMDQTAEPAVEKPQMARDLEGLDPKEGGISKGLRGSFTVRHYISGPWKGGSAVIELASDSSYAEIRIFDVDGNLQRIYSIQPKSQNTRINASQMGNPLEMVNRGNSTQSAPGASEAMNVQRSPEREAAVEAQTAQAIQGERDNQQFSTRVRPGTVSNRAGDIREANTPEVARNTETAAAPATTPKRRVIRVRRKRHHKKPSSSLDTPLSGEAAPAEDEYYYENVVVVEKPAATAAVSEIPAAKGGEKPIRMAKAEPAPPPPPSPKSSSPARDLEHAAARTSGSIPAPAGAASGSSAYDESNLPDVTEAVKDNESEATPAKPSMGSDAWKPKPTQVVALPGTPVEFPPQTSRVQQKAAPTEDLTAAKQAAAKLESDGWTPKPAAATPSDAELGLTATTGGTRGHPGRSKRGGSYDDMVPMSDQVRSGGQVGTGVNSWTPSQSAKLNPKEEQTLAMINSLKTVQPQVPVAKVNRDINNPEEGVKPFYSLEKYSGSQFGRHREFERRVMYKQNPQTSMKGYDFYIDEVDRKQEKHYLYYYKVDPKTKKAKLIATEKHERVTFLGNYDIASEDKGKVSKE